MDIEEFKVQGFSTLNLELSTFNICVNLCSSVV